MSEQERQAVLRELARDTWEQLRKLGVVD